MKISGVVMEKNEKNDELIVFTQNGEFLSVPVSKRNIGTGEVIEVETGERLENTGNKKRASIKSFMPAAAAAVVLLAIFMSVFFSFFSTPASAYVALDFNPSVELVVGENSQVKDYRTFNEDGQRLADSLDLKGMKVYEAVNEIVIKAIELDYIRTDGENLIMASVVPLGEGETIEKEKLKELITKNMRSKKLKGYISVNVSSKDIREEAIQKGMSVNRYMAMMHSPEQAEKYNPEEINNSNMMEMVDHDNMESMFERHNYMNMSNGHDRPGNMNSGGQNGYSHDNMPENNMHDNSNSDNNSREMNNERGSMEGGMTEEQEMHEEKINYHQEGEAEHGSMGNNNMKKMN